MDARIDVLLNLLARYRDELRATLDKIPEQQREPRPADGSWSVANVIEHLALTERSIVGLLSDFIAKAERRQDTDTFDRASFVSDIDMPVFLDRSRKIKGSQPSGTMSAADAWKALLAPHDGRHTAQIAHIASQ